MNPIDVERWNRNHWLRIALLDNEDVPEMRRGIGHHQLDRGSPRIEPVLALRLNRAARDVEIELILHILEDRLDLHAAEREGPFGTNRFKGHCPSPIKNLPCPQLGHKGIGIVPAWLGVKIPQDDAEGHDIDRYRLVLRVIVELNDPLRNFQMPNLHGGKSRWSLWRIRRGRSLRRIGRRYQLRQVQAPIPGHSCRDIGHSQANRIEHIGPTHKRAGLKIDEELLKAEQRGLIRLSNFEARHPYRERKGIQLHLFHQHRTVELLGKSRNRVGFNQVGKEEKTDERVAKHRAQGKDRKTGRTKQPAHG